MFRGLGPEAEAVLVTVKDVGEALGLLDKATSLLGEVYTDIRDPPPEAAICTDDARLREAQEAVGMAAIAIAHAEA